MLASVGKAASDVVGVASTMYIHYCWCASYEVRRHRIASALWCLVLVSLSKVFWICVERSCCLYIIFLPRRVDYYAIMLLLTYRNIPDQEKRPHSGWLVVAGSAHSSHLEAGSSFRSYMQRLAAASCDNHCKLHGTVPRVPETTKFAGFISVSCPTRSNAIVVSLVG